MKNNKIEYFPISTLREELRLRACDHASRLSRSVARLTSCDRQPCPEYGEEVAAEHSLAERMFYTQHCRDALERCIEVGGTTLRYRWADGSVTHTRFRKVGPGRVKVTGLLESAPQGKGATA